MMQHVDPNRDLKLTLGIAASGALALSPMALPSHTLAAVVPSTLAFGGAIASIAKANEFEHQDKIESDARERFEALQQDMDDAMLLSSQAFYTRNPQAWIEGRNVPGQWHTEYLRARFSPLPELQAPPVPQASIAPPEPQATTIHQPGQVRGGSFDPADGFAPQHPSAPSAPSAFESFAAPDDAWLDRLIAPSVLLLFGGDGSGKTSLAHELLQRRGRAGHQRIALDPHADPRKWPGCEVIGGGLNFGAIETAIARLESILKQRYQQIASGEVAPGGFTPITIACEELTDWKSSVANADLLIRKAGDYRKANIHLLLVAHGDSMSQIGAPDGTYEIVKNCVTKVRLLSKPGADGRPVPAMRGAVQYPLEEWFSITVPRFDRTEAPAHSNRPQSLAEHGFEPEPPERFEGSNHPGSTLEPPSGASPAQLEPEAFIPQQFAEFKSLGMNKAQIIFAIWQVRKGNSSRYRMASDFYDRLNASYGGDAA